MQSTTGVIDIIIIMMHQ